jgi:phosphate transport system permease protein
MAVAKETRDRGRSGRVSRAGDGIFQGLTLLFALVVVAAAVILLFALVKQAWPALSKVGLGVLGGQTWDPNHLVFGGLAFIYGTLVSSLVALILAGSVGVMVAVFLVEMAPPAFARPVSFLVEMLAAVPSIIFGLWGIFVLIPLVNPVQDWLNSTFGFIPIFGGTPSSGGSLLIASIVLAMMILPTVAAISRDVMAAVPGSQREGMLALGGTRWEVVRRVVIPYARAGIIGALILGLGRAVGETMAVTMVIGNDPHIHASLLASGYSIAALLANEAGEAFGSPVYIGALFELGLLLFAISLLLNALARLLVWQVNRGGATRR